MSGKTSTGVTSLTPDTTILILTWNARHFLPACLETLFAQDYPHFTVMVLDNDSTDGTPEWVRTHYPAVQVVENRRNLGFAAGNNVGLRQTQTPFVVLVNPDVELAPDWLTQLLAPMRQDATIGIVGCKIYEPGGTILQHAGGYITQPQALSGHYGLGERDRGQHDEPREVEYVMGAAMAIQQEVVQSIGLLDEGFFLYYEDVDYCERARKAGYHVAYIPGAHLIHHESSTTQRGSAFYYGHTHAGRWRYMLKHYTAEQLQSATVPAELAWLAQRGREERLGLQFAYCNAQRQLPFLWSRRAEYNPTDQTRTFDRLNSAILRMRTALWAEQQTAVGTTA